MTFIKNRLAFSLFTCLLMIAIGKANPSAQRQIDSVTTILSQTTNLKKQSELHLQLSELAYDNDEFQSALEYANKAHDIARKTKNDAIRSKALLQMGASARRLKNYEKAWEYFRQSYTLAYKMNDLATQAKIHSQIGEIHRVKSEMQKALDAFRKSLAIYRKIKDDIGIAEVCSRIGYILFFNDDYAGTIERYTEAYLLFENLDKDWHTADAAFYLAVTYLALRDNEQAIHYFNISREISEKLNDKETIAAIYQNFARMYREIENYDSALYYGEKSLKMHQELERDSGRPTGITSSFREIAAIHSDLDEWDKALAYYQQALSVAEKANVPTDKSKTWFYIAQRIKWPQEQFGETLHYLDSAEVDADSSHKAAIWRLKARIYNQQKEFPKAKAAVEKAIAYHEVTQEKAHLRSDYQTLSSINENMGDYKAALANYILYKAYDDSVRNNDASKTVMKYEFQKNEEELKARQQQVLNEKITKANTTYAMLGVVIVLVGSGLYIYRQRNKRLSVEKEFLDLQRREAELAKDTEAFKSKFLSNISHEFRTPLTLINGHLEILKTEDDTKNRQRFNEMEYSSKRLLQLINQLLDLTKIETGKYSLYYRKGNLLNETQNYVQAFHSFAAEREISLETTVTFAAQVKFAHRDFAYSSEALASIFNNLLSNALKFTPEGGNVHTTIDYVGGKLYISVRDTGPGIPENDLPHIFDRFYQTKQDEQPTFEGSGIGLAIVKELSQIHHGDAKVMNNPNGGSTFTVWLAEGNSVSEVQENEEVSVVSPPDVISVVQQEKTLVDEDKALVLVVEDQRELRKFIVENLGLQYNIIEAENGRQGLEYALEQLPDIIISDVMMPEINGFQLTQAIKTNEISSHIPIILLTAKAEQTDKIEGLEYGADDYLTKPFSIAELQLRVKNRLNQQALLRQKFANNPLPLEKEETAELHLLDRNFIEKLNSIIHTNIDKDIDVSILASEIGLSNSQLTRKLKVLIGVTPANFIKNIRMDVALKLLRDGYTVSESSWKTGFEESAYFSKVFKKHFGFLPSEA